MSKKFSLTSLLENDKIIYAAPLLLCASLFHIFSTAGATHSFGQIEVLASMIAIGYYLWNTIAVIYPPEKIGKKRIEAVACMVGSIFLALLPLAPLMTWQFINLYRTSNRFSHTKQIIIAIVTIWLGVSVLYYSSIKLIMDRQSAMSTEATESSMPTPVGAN